MVSFNRRQELKQRKQDAERQTTAVSALLDLCKSAAVSTSADNMAAFDVGDNAVIDTPVVDNNINPATDFMVATRVLHGPGLGPRAGPARSPWAGPGFYDILRAGPGAGLKLAGPGRARAGK